MKQRFFTTTLVSNFIKSLIYNTPIPLIDSVNDNSYILKDNLYIYKNSIIKCTKSGIIKMPDIDNSYEAYYRNGDIKIISPEDIAAGDSHGSKYESVLNSYVKLEQGSFKVIDSYAFGMYYPKFTELYYSKYGYYDTLTHEHLGDLLRIYRDLFEINLMPYYNCVSGNYISGIVITADEVKQGDSSDYRTFRIPIKFNTNYTLAIDCSSNVRVAPILLSGNYVINNISYYTDSGSTVNFNPNTNISNQITTFNSMSFKHPELVGVSILRDENAGILQQYERYLCLLIQVPKENNSSIVLLEGDYSRVTNNVYDISGLRELGDLELSNIMTSELSLLQMNDKVTYPFADRLVEYLLLNVINTRDPITKNIKRVQDLFVDTDSIPEVWSNTLRSDIYLTYQKNILIKQLDLNGFVDIDTERLMKKLN